MGILDTSDLDSVASFAQHFLTNHTQLHYLVNNAGIHYVSMDDGAPMKNLSIPLVSPQGYDLAFATNYLGHFLLTELLLPLIAETSTFGAIINIASTFHYQSDGSMLKIPHKRTTSGNIVAARDSTEEDNINDDDDNDGDQDQTISPGASSSTSGEGESDSSSVDATPADDQVTVDNNNNSSSSSNDSSNNNSTETTGTVPPADVNSDASASSTPPAPPKNRWWSATGLLPDLGTHPAAARPCLCPVYSPFTLTNLSISNPLTYSCFTSLSTLLIDTTIPLTYLLQALWFLRAQVDRRQPLAQNITVLATTPTTSHHHRNHSQ